MSDKQQSPAISSKAPRSTHHPHGSGSEEHRRPVRVADTGNTHGIDAQQRGIDSSIWWIAKLLLPPSWVKSLQSHFKPAQEAKHQECPLQQRIAVPKKLMEKQQHKVLLEILLKQCNYDPAKIHSYDGPAPPADHVTVVPCVIQSRVGSDLAATFRDAHMDPAVQQNATVIVFTPKAKHVQENMVSTYTNMAGEFKATDMVDVYFSDGEIYKCGANDKAREQMKQILREEDSAHK